MKEYKKTYIIGTRYFDKEKNIIKMIKVKNENTFTMIDADRNKFTITKDELYKNYTKLVPSGHLQFAIIEYQGKKDVTVSLYRNKKIGIEAELGLPFCICRQNIVNVFYELSTGAARIKHLGMSISLETCPSNIDYRDILKCTNVLHQDLIAVYMDDNFDEILSLIKHDKYDRLLKDSKENNKNNPLLLGSQSSLKSLLKEENFSYDFYRAFGIYEINDPLLYHEEQFNDATILTLNREQEIYFEKEFNIEMIKSFVFKFDYSIILNKIQMEHFLIYSSIDKQLYVILYAVGRGLNPEEKSQIMNMKNQVAYFNSII